MSAAPYSREEIERLRRGGDFPAYVHDIIVGFSATLDARDGAIAALGAQVKVMDTEAGRRDAEIAALEQAVDSENERFKARGGELDRKDEALRKIEDLYPLSVCSWVLAKGKPCGRAECVGCIARAALAVRP